MAEQENKKKRWRFSAWAGLWILVLLVGLAPVIVLFTYTRSDLWDRWFKRNPENTGQPEIAVEQETVSYLVQYLYRYCDHSQIYADHQIPVDAPLPPQSLIDLSQALISSNYNLESYAADINVPEGWHLTDLSSEMKQPRFLLTLVQDICPHCQGHFYLGLFDNCIAIYEGHPPGGMLVEITDFKVKDTDRENLKNGIPFETEEQKQMLMETFTS